MDWVKPFSFQLFSIPVFWISLFQCKALLVKWSLAVCHRCDYILGMFFGKIFNQSGHNKLKSTLRQNCINFPILFFFLIFDLFNLLILDKYFQNRHPCSNRKESRYLMLFLTFMKLINIFHQVLSFSVCGNHLHHYLKKIKN